MKFLPTLLLVCLPVMVPQNSYATCNNTYTENLCVDQDPEEIEKATAIFWVDKKKHKNTSKLKVRTMKAKVIIFNDGRVKLKSFVKVQSPNVEKYILAQLEEFRVTKRMFEGGYIEPGEQYVQIRYIPANVK